MDMRYKKNKEYALLVKRNHIAGLAVVWFFLVIAFLILWQTITKTQKTSPSPLKQTVEVKVQEVIASETPCDFDPITYVRCSGEKLGKSNKDIMTLIRIMKCESGGRTDALNKNTNGTFDVGVLQLNDVHNKRISRADRMNFVKNIDFGWRLHTEQGGFQAWSCYKKVK